MRRTTRATLALLNVMLILAACSSRTRGGVTSNPTLISENEIQAEMRAGVSNLYDLIQRTHPRWLQGRSDRSLNLETTKIGRASCRERV